MNIFLGIQATYSTIEIALFNEETVISMISIDKLDASKKIISVLDMLFKNNHYTLDNISFIASNQGPGPFTLLRTVLTTVNAISFARNIPLIGIDGLNAFFVQEKNSIYPNTVMLLNAFNNDVYFAFHEPNMQNRDTRQIQNSDTIKIDPAFNTNTLEYVYDSDTIKTGYKNIDSLLALIATTFPADTIRFLGNGTQIFEQQIKQLFGSRALIPEQLPLNCSMETIGSIAWQQWVNTQTGVSQLTPLYLKKHAVEMSPTAKLH